MNTENFTAENITFVLNECPNHVFDDHPHNLSPE